MKFGKIPKHIVEKFSAIQNHDSMDFPTIKKCNYFVDDSISIDGDAPKKFIGVYDYNLLKHRHRNNRRNWIRYIAKTGHKWYPSESITELLLNSLGEIYGLKMADSRLAYVGGQLRFMSRYFLNQKKDELVHGAVILAGFLNDSTTQFIEDVDRQNLTRELLTLQFIDKAVETMFLHQKEEIMSNLSKLLIFDALVGNNDRHFFNWGVVKSIRNSYQPYFSPIYDTARGLFWNYSEDKISNVINNDNHIKKYCETSKPKIGWEGLNNPNHFKLFEEIYINQFYISKNEIRNLLTYSKLDEMKNEVKNNFSRVMSYNRVKIICKCLDFRFNKMISLL